MDTPATLAWQYLDENFHDLAQLCLANEKVCRSVVGALGSIIGDWNDNEGLAAPETTLNHVCNTFCELLEENYLATQVTPEPLPTSTVPPDLGGTGDDTNVDTNPVKDSASRSSDYKALTWFHNLVTRTDTDTRLATWKPNLHVIYLLAVKGFEHTFYRE